MMTNVNTIHRNRLVADVAGSGSTADAVGRRLHALIILRGGLPDNL